MSKKNMNMLLLLALAGGAAYFLFVKKKPAMAGQGAQQIGTVGGQPALTDAAYQAQAAQSEANAAIAQAKAAQAIAEAQAGEWYSPLMEGIGAGTGKFLGGLGGLLG